MITAFLLLMMFVVIGVAVLVYSKNRGKGRAGETVQRAKESTPSVGRADGSGND